ncbi:MAG: TIM barrel protein [Planctomycetota bacterium]|nr:TIM barrel protein [Planctomycetota bacterium]
MLNAMANRDFEQSLAKHAAWNLRWLDLKDRIFEKLITDLTLEEARRAKALIDARGLRVYCLSTLLFADKVEKGEEHFRARHLAPVAHTLELARILQPVYVRLIAAQSAERSTFANSAQFVAERHPWLFECYREAIDAIHAAGFKTAIENEIDGSLFAHPLEVIDFFEALDRDGKAVFTWDVQNFWEQGTFPTLQVYEALRPLIGFYHLKGGQTDGVSNTLAWRTCLEDASWPVAEITRRVVADGVSPVICLNPSHGKPKPGYDYANTVERDLAFIRRAVPGVE